MPIDLARFGGIIPKLNPNELPPTGAQKAENCDLVSQSLRPISVDTPFFDLKGDDGRIEGELDENSVFHTPQPIPPLIKDIDYFARNLDQWVGVRRSIYVAKVSADLAGNTFDDIVHETNGHGFSTPSKVVYTETGMRITFDIPAINLSLPDGFTYQIISPVFQFLLVNSPFNGSPDENFYLPTQLGRGYTSTIPRGRIPLVYRTPKPDANIININDNEDFEQGVIYGYFEVEDADFFPIDKTITNPSGNGTLNETFIAGQVTFTINMNYSVPKRRTYYYVQTYLKDRNLNIESIPSEISEAVELLPGQIPTLNTNRVDLEDGYIFNNLYRSGSGDGFRLLAEVDDDEFTDTEFLPLRDSLPPFGNAPVVGEANLQSFIEGSLIHPGQFGVAFKDNILYFSDFYKYHVWPDEYTVTFANNIEAIMLSGGSIIVYTNEDVFVVSGGDPARMNKYLVTNVNPLLDKKSLCRIGNTIFYVSHDGLFATSGSSVRNLTSEYYTRTEWLDLLPETFSAKVADNSIFLEGNLVNLRFDIDETIQAITTFTDTSNTSGFTWRSKKYHFTHPEIFDYCKVDADGDVTIKIYVDGSLAGTFTAKDYNPVVLENLSHGIDWEFELVGNVEVRSFQAFERNIIAMGQSINLTKSNNPVWKISWLKFSDVGAFSGGIVTTENNKPVSIRFFHESEGLVHNALIHSGRVFKLPEHVPDGTLWRVSIENDISTPIESLTLFSRSRQIIKDKIHEFRSDPSVGPWDIKVYDTLKPISFSCAQVFSTGYPVKVKFFGDNDELYTISFTNEKPRRLPHSKLMKKFTFEVDENGSVVREFAVATSMAKLK
jgi:hypothetical protein